MANQRLTDKTVYAANLASGDKLMLVDKSDTTGSASGTSKQVDNKFIIQTDIVTGNLDLLTTPLQLVAAPGAGFFIQPLVITVIYTYNSVASTTANNLYASYDTASPTNYIFSQRDFIRNESADRTYVLGAFIAPSDGTFAGSIVNKKLLLHSSADLGGNGAFKVYTTYQVVKE